MTDGDEYEVKFVRIVRIGSCCILCQFRVFMFAPKIEYPHLSFRKNDGLPVIDRVNFKAIHLIANHLAHGWTAEELVINFPQLTLGEVYSTLSWFSDHRSDVEEFVKQRARITSQQALENRHRQIASRLVEEGKLEAPSKVV